MAGLVYIMPKLAKRIEESKPLRTAVAVLCVLFMCLAIAVNAINREAQEHKSEGQDARMIAVEATNDQILHAVLNPSPDVSEPARRYRVEEVLRNRYILTHTDIAPEILAKAAWPPTEWMNQQLEALHEKFRFAEEPPKSATIVQQILPEPKKAEIGVSFYSDEMIKNPSHDIVAVVNASDLQTFNVDVTAFGMGEVTAKNVKLWFRACGECSWASEPSGSSSVPEHPLDREFQIGEIVPNVAIPKMTFSIKRPTTTNKVELEHFHVRCIVITGETLRQTDDGEIVWRRSASQVA
jgi:hypothetical protein